MGFKLTSTISFYKLTAKYVRNKGLNLKKLNVIEGSRMRIIKQLPVTGARPSTVLQ